MTYFRPPLQSLPLLSAVCKQLRQETATKEPPKPPEISPKLAPADGTLAAGERCRYPTSSRSGYVMCVELWQLQAPRHPKNAAKKHRGAQGLAADPMGTSAVGSGAGTGGVDSALPSSQKHCSILKREQEAA